MSKRKALLREINKAHIKVIKKAERSDIPQAQKEWMRTVMTEIMEFIEKESTDDLEAFLMSLRSADISQFDPNEIFDEFKN